MRQDGFVPARRRALAMFGGATAALALAPLRMHAAPLSSDAAKRRYPAKVVDLVQRSLVIDMLAPLKLDFTPEAYANAARRQPRSRCSARAASPGSTIP